MKWGFFIVIVFLYSIVSVHAMEQQSTEQIQRSLLSTIDRKAHINSETFYIKTIAKELMLNVECPVFLQPLATTSSSLMPYFLVQWQGKKPFNITTYVEDDKLDLSTFGQGSTKKYHSTIEVIIFADTLKKLSLKGLTKLAMHEKVWRNKVFEAENIIIELQDCTYGSLCNVDFEKCDIKVNNSGHFSCQGNVDWLSVLVANQGFFNGEKLRAQKVIPTVCDNGQIYINVLKSLNYKGGNPHGLNYKIQSLEKEKKEDENV